MSILTQCCSRLVLLPSFISLWCLRWQTPWYWVLRVLACFFFGCFATGHHSFLMLRSFTNQLRYLYLFRYWKESGSFKTFMNVSRWQPLRPLFMIRTSSLPHCVDFITSSLASYIEMLSVRVLGSQLVMRSMPRSTIRVIRFRCTLVCLRRPVKVPSYGTQTRPAIEFVSGEVGLRPASSSISSSIRSLSTWT